MSAKFSRGGSRTFFSSKSSYFDLHSPLITTSITQIIRLLIQTFIATSLTCMRLMRTKAPARLALRTHEMIYFEFINFLLDGS